MASHQSEDTTQEEGEEGTPVLPPPDESSLLLSLSGSFVVTWNLFVAAFAVVLIPAVLTGAAISGARAYVGERLPFFRYKGKGLLYVRALAAIYMMYPSGRVRL